MITYLDIIGAIFSFLSTIAYIRINVLAWPLGLISICIDFYLYWNKGIYGDVSLHLLYLVLTIYGWYQWKYGGNNKSELSIGTLSRELTLLLSIVATTSIIMLYLLLKDFTNSQIPLLDATTTVLSLIAQWLICKKIIQCWFLWLIVDAMYSCVYLYKGIPAHASIQMLYVTMAVAGYWRWKKQLANQSTAIPITANS